MKPYYSELKDKIEFKKQIKLDSFPRRFNQAMSSVNREGGYREKTILEDIGSIEINDHNGIITADIYNTEGDGFQCVVDHIPPEGKRPHYKPGDIVG